MSKRGKKIQHKRLEKLSLKELIGYGLGDAGFNFYWAIIGSYLVFFYTEVFGITAAAAATMVTVTKVIDAFTDPAMGALADRTKTRWGKFRPYLLFGCVPLTAAGILTLSTPDLSDSGKLVWAYVTYSLLMLTYTAVNIPYSSLSAVLSADGEERNRINSSRFFFAYLSSIIVGAATPDIASYFGGGDLNSARGWQITMMIYAAIASVLFLITFLTTRERVQPLKSQKAASPIVDLKALFSCFPWLVLFGLAMIFVILGTLRSASAAYYFKYYIGRLDLLGPYIGLQFFGLMIGALMASPLAKFIDKKKLLMVMLTIGGGLSILLTYVPQPDNSGVLHVDEYTSETIQASSLLEADSAGQIEWFSHEKGFWKFTKRVKLEETATWLQTSDYTDKILSVRYVKADGTIIDSGKTPSEIYIIFLLNFLISIALGVKPPITWGMYADLSDFNEWETGRRATGMTFAATTFSQKLGSTIGSAVLLSMLAYFGYEANSIQGDASRQGIVYLQTFIPGVLAIVTASTLLFYKLDQSTLDNIQLELAARSDREQ
ncbi:MAG: glycoside-pentoside-hexuronide (GPH):cation symporter [Maricaulaceae bacterium]